MIVPDLWPIWPKYRASGKGRGQGCSYSIMRARLPLCWVLHRSGMSGEIGNDFCFLPLLSLPQGNQSRLPTPSWGFLRA